MEKGTYGDQIAQGITNECRSCLGLRSEEKEIIRNEWISTQEKLPDVEGTYLIYIKPICSKCDNDKNWNHIHLVSMRFEYYISDFDEGEFDIEFDGHYISHWAYLPSIPW